MGITYEDTQGSSLDARYKQADRNGQVDAGKQEKRHPLGAIRFISPIREFWIKSADGSRR